MSTKQVNPKHQVFSAKRFWLHTKAIYAEKRRPFLWFFAIIAMIYSLVLLLYFSTSTHYDWNAQAFMYYSGLFITGFVFSARYYSHFAKKGSALLALMQPVSVFEKWLLAAITTLIIYPVLYTSLYSIMTLPVVLLTNTTNFFEETREVPWFFLPFTAKQHYSYFKQLPIWFFYQMICAYTLTGSVFFKSLPLLKTFVLAFGLFLFFVLMLINIEPEDDVLFFFFSFDLDINVSWIQLILANVLFWIVPTILLWMASFYALKERELL